MVMCAGEGTRLRPLTYVCPKPLVPVANRPVLEYTLLNLRKHGFKEVVINLSRANREVQQHFKDGSSLGIRIHYSIEKNLMGTAGGVKNAEHFFAQDPDADILVVSGDNLTDIDFSKFIQYHKKKQSYLSIAVTQQNSRLEYGVTLFNKRDRIYKFLEKPSWGDIFSNFVNTGIYLINKQILSHIPKDRFYDFGKELLPKLLRMNVPLYGYKFKEFWTDIGTLEEYRHAQEIVGDRKIQIPPKGKCIKPGIWVGEGTRLPKDVRLKAPCSIGEFCRIAPKSMIGPYSFIGNRCTVGGKSVILRSILWSNSIVSDGVKIQGTILISKKVVPSHVAISGGLILDDKDFKEN